MAGIPDWKLRTKTGSMVQGSPRRTGQRPETVAESVARKAKERADKNQKKPAPKDSPAGPRKTAVNGMTARVSGPLPAPTKKIDSSPGPGASGTGGGRDTPGAGKERGQFEQDRQRERGTGKDRPPIYKPPPHTPGGYQSSKGGSAKPIHEQVRDADEETKQKIRDILDGKAKSKPIPAPPKKKLPPIGNGGIVRGLVR